MPRAALIGFALSALAAGPASAARPSALSDVALELDESEAASEGVGADSEDAGQKVALGVFGRGQVVKQREAEDQRGPCVDGVCHTCAEVERMDPEAFEKDEALLETNGSSNAEIAGQANASRTGEIGKLDKFKAWCCDNTRSSEWTDSFWVFRVTENAFDASYRLKNANAVNYAGLFKFINGGGAIRPGGGWDAAAFQIQVNRKLTSDYYHCNGGRTEFRFVGNHWTDIRALRSTYNRVGIEQPAASIQTSRCGRASPCYKDYCVSEAEAEDRIQRCLQGHVDQNTNAQSCFYAFTPEGEGVSYTIKTIRVRQVRDLQSDFEASVEDWLA
ncbi:unnamed protein product [Prorocentrum cordatum]|uniref:Uncharacterized protein n=1 Tax=Prorocentrum cordatum TaxID=2364126 RepID=A0ABN9WEL8_9DINO|nr:unnamed protein product [Polarella glacialis]